MWAYVFKRRSLTSLGSSIRLLLLFLVCVNILQYAVIHRLRSNRKSTSIVRYRVKQQNTSSQFQFVRFRDLLALTTRCESMTVIDCLAYLQHNQSEYFQPMSSEQLTTFKNKYCRSTNKMLYHTFWNDGSALDHQVLRLHIDSFLYTQNRHCSHLIVWVVPPIDANRLKVYNTFYEPDVEFRSLIEIEKELNAIGLYIDSSWSSLLWRWIFNHRAQLGDAARFIILHQLGGLYIDVDTLYLRDLQPFFDYEFGYRWSYIDAFNTAVLRLFPQSNISAIIIRHGKDSRSAWAFYPPKLHRYGLPSSFYRLPCVFFDTIWLIIDRQDPKTQRQWEVDMKNYDGFKDPYRKSSGISRKGRHVFDGGFTFHWHSSNGLAMFERDSFLDRWRNFLDRALFEKYPSRLIEMTEN